MGQEPDNICGYTWPEDYEVGDKPDQQSCCYRIALDDTNRCAWHADRHKTDKKTVDNLKDGRVDLEIIDQTGRIAVLRDGSLLTGFECPDWMTLSNSSFRSARLFEADLQYINLKFSDFSGAEFHNADLSHAEMFRTKLNDAELHSVDLVNSHITSGDLSGANMSDTNLTEADLSNSRMVETNLENADLTDTNLENADLTNAVLYKSDLIRTDLRGTNLSGANLCNAIINDVYINGETTVGKQSTAENKAKTAGDWDEIARAYHNLKISFSEAGLIGKARKHHYLERRARGYEKKASTELNPWVTPSWLGSVASRYLIGYGVRVRPLTVWMAILFIGSTLVYINFGVEETAIANISYSVRAFTVAPPRAPVDLIPHIVMMIETFFGTLSIVLLGYVLGNREQF